MNPYDQQSMYNLAQLLQQSPNSAMKLQQPQGTSRLHGMLAGMLGKGSKPSANVTPNQASAFSADAGPVNAAYADKLARQNQNDLMNMAGSSPYQTNSNPNTLSL